MAISVHNFFDYAALRAPFSDEEDPWMLVFLNFAATMALGGLLYELSIWACISMMYLRDTCEEEHDVRNRLILNRKMIIVFAVLTGTYHAMAWDVQWVHEGWLSKCYGGAQVIYSVRYLEWTFCSPILLSVLGDPFQAHAGHARNGILASSLLTGAYCMISWQGLVVQNVCAAWCCIGWAFLCYIVASWEQLSWAWHLKDQDGAGRLKAGLIFYLVVMFGVYGLVYLCGMWGRLPSTLENKFYCIFDLTFKFGTSVSMVAMYDVSTTSRNRAQAEIVADDLRGLIDTASVPIFGVDSAGKIDQWNQKASSLLGFSEAEATSRLLLDLIGSCTRAEVAEATKRALAKERTGSVQVTMTTRSMEHGEGNGVPATLILSASPRRGKSSGVTFMGCDLTQVEAYKEAEARKERFMAVVSHELLSPLHGIIGLAGQLEESEVDASKQQKVSLVKGCASRLLDLVASIMEMSRLAQTDGKGQKTLKLRCEDVEVPKLIEESIVLARNLTDKARRPLLKPGVAIVNRVRSMPVIRADKHRCMQVFFNVIENACKFTQKGEITLSSVVDPGGRWVDVYVQDTGLGIARQSLVRIFEPFEQEDNSDNRHYEGIGLGLAIARDVVRLHGGRIDVQSQVGVGTTFAIRLPMEAGQIVWTEALAPLPPQPTSEAGEVEAEPEPNLTPKRVRRERPLVLSVDDDLASHMVTEGMLREMCDIEMIMDGEEAIKYLERCGSDLPDVAIIGIVLPSVSGLELCQHIREKMQLSPTELPVILVSANPSETLRVEGCAVGCNHYFALPIDKRELQAAVQECTGD